VCCVGVLYPTHTHPPIYRVYLRCPEVWSVLVQDGVPIIAGPQQHAGDTTPLDVLCIVWSVLLPLLQQERERTPSACSVPSTVHPIIQSYRWYSGG